MDVTALLANNADELSWVINSLEYEIWQYGLHINYEKT